MLFKHKIQELFSDGKILNSIDQFSKNEKKKLFKKINNLQIELNLPVFKKKIDIEKYCIQDFINKSFQDLETTKKDNV